MGMYDDVAFEMDCPACDGGKITEFQSKSGPCTLSVLDPTEVARFYGWCGNCGEYVTVESPITTPQPPFKAETKSGKKYAVSRDGKILRQLNWDE